MILYIKWNETTLFTYFISLVLLYDFIILKRWASRNLIITTHFHEKPFSKQLQYPQSLQLYRKSFLYLHSFDMPSPVHTLRKYSLSINSASLKVWVTMLQCQQQLLNKNYRKSLFLIKLLNRLSQKPKWSHLHRRSQSPSLAKAVCLTFHPNRTRD